MSHEVNQHQDRPVANGAASPGRDTRCSSGPGSGSGSARAAGARSTGVRFADDLYMISDLEPQSEMSRRGQLDRRMSDDRLPASAIKRSSPKSTPVGRAATDTPPSEVSGDTDMAPNSNSKPSTATVADLFADTNGTTRSPSPPPPPYIPWRTPSPPPLSRSEVSPDLASRRASRGSSRSTPTPSHTPGTSTPTTGGSVGRRKKAASTPPPPPIIVADLPTAWDAALASFESLERCVYERKDLGLSREQDEMMVCDCVYDPDDPDAAPCGQDSNCINRAIFIECLASECRAGNHCQNQRLARKQHAKIDIIQTERKGFGVRAADFIPNGSLIYEYIGEVVVEKTFRKRMAQYADEGIKHFYFMMLQKEEYIDATKKGGIGRFANHSCNPNCEVQKWVVGRRMRMGIFAKRDIIQGEEVTFNYNVDRYGHEAQPCYCGEPNCVGTIGGKTQTDIAGMDDLFLDALGITDEVNAGGMKGNKRKKAAILDEDYVPILRPITEQLEAMKVAAAMRQSMGNPTMINRLLERIKLTDEPVIQRQLMRMHGFSLMAIILNDLSGHRDIVMSALEAMDKWKHSLSIRNKIEDSKIEEPVLALADGDDQELSTLAMALLQEWSTLELSYKIPRVNKIASLDSDDANYTTTIDEADAAEPIRPAYHDNFTNNAAVEFDLAPVRSRGPPGFPPFRHRQVVPPPPPKPVPAPVQRDDRGKLDAIIAMAQQARVAPPTSSSVQSPSPALTKSEGYYGDYSESRKRQKTLHRSSAEEEARKEKRLSKLIGDHVVRSMSKYKEQMEYDTFKRYAKECTMILVEKEKRSPSYTDHKYPSLSDAKKAKIKSFTKEFTHKVLKRLKQKGKLIDVRHKHVQSSPNAQASGSSPAIVSAGNGSSGILDEMFGQDDVDEEGEGDDRDGSMVAQHTPLGSASGGSGLDSTPMDLDTASATPHDTPWRDLGTPSTSSPALASPASANHVHFVAQHRAYHSDQDRVTGLQMDSRAILEAKPRRGDGPESRLGLNGDTPLKRRLTPPTAPRADRERDRARDSVERVRRPRPPTPPVM